MHLTLRPYFLEILTSVSSYWLSFCFSSFFSGFLPSLFLVTNPATQFAVYEQLSRLVLRRRARAAAAAGADGATPSATAALAAAAAKLSPIESFVIGAIAKAVATVVTYPYQVRSQCVLYFITNLPV